MKTLITGVSGSGKTTIAAALVGRGHHALNLDKVKGLCAWIDLATGQPAGADFKRESADDWKNKYDWLWDEQELKKLLNKPLDTYFCGSSGNQKKFYTLFDKVFLLEMDEPLLRHRVFTCERDHDYGRRPGEIEEILDYYQQEQDDAKASGAIVIDAHQSVDEIINLVLSETVAK